MLLRTSRLALREFREADVPAVLSYQRDPRYLRLYAWTDRTVAVVGDLVQRFLEWQEEAPRRRIQLAITLPTSDDVIGSVGLRRASAEARVGDLGFELSPAHWGQGYATEAAAAMLRHGFDQLELHRVGAQCIAENEASARVLEKLGMRKEGRLRENEYFKERWWDTLLFGILADEWRQRPSF